MLQDKPLDHRYEVVKIMLEIGKIHLFSDIFLYLPKTIVAEDSKIKLPRFNQYLADLTMFQIKQLDAIASRIGVELEDIMPLVVAELLEQRDSRKAKILG